MAVTWDEWAGNVEKLRKNAEKYGLENLKRDYAKGYQKITEKIAVQTREICTELLVGGMRTLGGSDQEWQTCLKRINLILRQEKDAFREVSRAVFRDYDPDKAINIVAEKVWPRVWFQAYGPYWVSCCREDCGKTVCSLLPGMEWNAEHNLWEGTTGDGFPCWTVMLPPTMEQLEKEFREWRSGE